MANPYFNAAYYLATNLDVLAAGYTVETAEQHYLQHGAAEALSGANTARKPAPWFDIQFYLTSYPDLLAGGITAQTAFQHFVTHGQFEQRSPANGLTVTDDALKAYADANEDLRTAFDITDTANLTDAQKDALTSHFYQYGYAEDREGAPFDSDVNPGEALTLTAGVDNLVGSAKDDVFNASLALNPSTGAVNIQTLNAFDTLDGAGGNDTLNIQYTGAVASVPTNAVKNIETVNIKTDNGVTHDLTKWEGVKTLNVEQAGTGALQAFAVKGAESVSVKGGADVYAVDNASDQTLGTAPTAVAATTGADLKAVSVDGASGAVIAVGNGINSLTLANLTANADATVFAKAGERELNLNLSSVTGTRTVADATATSLNVVASGKYSEGITLNAAAATTVVIDNSATAKSATDKSGLTIADVNIAAAKSLVAKGSSLTTITATSTVTALETISSEESTGGLAIVATLGNSVVFKGGEGNDAINLGATTKAQTMGAGDDKVTLTGSALGTGGSVDGGEGRDTLVMTAANAVTATATNSVANFAGKVKGFESLEVTGAVAAAADIKVFNLNANANNAVDAVVLAGAQTNSFSISGLKSDNTLTFKDSSTGTVTVAVSGADTGVNDILNVKITNAASKSIGTLTAANVETINFATDDTATTATGLKHTAIVTGNDVTTITVAGDAGIALTAASTALTTLDASGVTKGAVEWTAGALTKAATVSAGQDGSTISLALATKAVTFNGGAKVDTVTSGKGADIFTLGAGNDKIIYTDAGQSGVTIATSDKVLDWGVGTDILEFTAGGTITAAGLTAQATVQAAVDAVSGSGFATVLLEAATAIGVDKAGAFQFEGNTYVLANDGTLAVDSGDLLIQLVGEHTLTADNFSFV